MSTWENKTVDITWTAGLEGDTLYFGKAPIQPPRYKFLGVYIPSENGGAPILSHYSVVFDPGYMVQYWSGVNLFPLGTTPVPALSGLPPWNTSSETMGIYTKALLPIREELINRSVDYQRLEGLMSVYYHGDARVDRVCMYYLSGAIQHGNGVTSDLVYVSLAFADRRDQYTVRENGGASGPPH